MAYAAIVSVKQTIKRLLSCSDSRILLPKSELESVNKALCSLQSILESISYLQSSERVDDLKGLIKGLASKLEDLIKSHTSDPESESSRDESLTLAFSQELLNAKQELISLTETLKTEQGQQPSSAFAADVVSSRAEPDWEIKKVGLLDELRKIKQWLLDSTEELDVISIVGMAGIGKTALAKEVYEDQLVSENFKQRFFVSVGPKYQLKEFLLYVVDQMGIPIDDIHKKRDEQIAVDLYRFLVGRKYLIVLDDVWNTQVWDKLKCFFPRDHRDGSRIVLTTRQEDVADLATNNSEHIVKAPFLHEHQSWNLLCQMVFPTGECPRELEKIGKQIARKCDGLPLAIVSVANFIREDGITVEKWSSFLENEMWRRISGEALFSSFNQLPPHLTQCFLYTGVFPPNYEIPTSKLLKLWVAEGLFEREANKTLEEMAREYLDELVARSLILVGERSSRGRSKSCRIHFLIRNMCVTIAEKVKFFYVLNKYADSLAEGAKDQQRLCVHSNVLFALRDVHRSMDSNIPTARSLLCVGPQHQHPLKANLSFALLRVLDALTIRFYEFPFEVLGLVELKYLAITYDGELPASISGLQNLEVFIVHRHHRIKSSDVPVYLPVEIWMLRRLKHLDCTGFELPDPSAAARRINDDGSDCSLILEQLLTLSGVGVHSCTRGVFAGMPNLLKLRILVGSTETFTSFGYSINICRNLESFKCIVMNRGLTSPVVSPSPAFPGNVKKITLSRCIFGWEDMRLIGRLPHLEVLKLRCYAFRGPKWETYAGEFVSLKFLLLEDMDIEQWEINHERCTMSCEHFPQLTHLIIRHCYKLRGIPNDIIDFPAVELIEVDECSPSAMKSARELQVELEDCGNEFTQCRIYSSWEGDRHYADLL